jgi:hypothetical protein
MDTSDSVQLTQGRTKNSVYAISDSDTVATQNVLTSSHGGVYCGIAKGEWKQLMVHGITTTVLTSRIARLRLSCHPSRRSLRQQEHVFASNLVISDKAPSCWMCRAWWDCNTLKLLITTLGESQITSGDTTIWYPVTGVRPSVHPLSVLVSTRPTVLRPTVHPSHCLLSYCPIRPTVVSS